MNKNNTDTTMRLQTHAWYFISSMTTYETLVSRKL